jgi:2-hydroxychromene-2-carboxylate isomerase
MAERAAFYYDFSSPYSYLAAERISGVFAEAGAEQPLWRPISFAFVLRRTGRTPWSLEPAGPHPDHLEEIQRRAAERGLSEVRYPRGWPAASYSLAPLRAALFAEGAGKLIAFSLAAFRQQFAAGRDLGDPDNLILAAASCELHPRAVLRGIESASIKERLRENTDEAIERGVIGVPTVAVAGRLYWGDDRLEEAAVAAAGGA